MRQCDLYYLRERFFNIWYLMRVAPKRSQTRVVWLVRFLENWYDPVELHRRARQHIQAVSMGSFHPKAAYYLTEALARTGKLDLETEYEMKAVTRELLLERDQSLVTELSPSDQELLEESYACYDNENYEKALSCLLSINNRDAHINFGSGICYEHIKNYEKAEHYYLQAIEHGHTDAMYNLGRLYDKEYKDYEKAEHYYLQAIEYGYSGAMNNLGILYFEQKIKKQEALKSAQYIAETKKSSSSAHTLACIYIWHNQFEKALQAAEIFMVDKTFYETHEQDVILYLMLLLAKKRYADVSEYFEREKLTLKEKFKPLYYALLYLSENPSYQKLPPELSEPVHNVLKRVQQLAIDYA